MKIHLIEARLPFEVANYNSKKESFHKVEHFCNFKREHGLMVPEVDIKKMMVKLIIYVTLILNLIPIRDLIPIHDTDFEFDPYM